MFPRSPSHPSNPHRKWLIACVGATLPAILLALTLFTIDPSSVEAQAPSIMQCNDEAASNVGGQGIFCTITVVNHVTSDGTIFDSSPSTVTMTRCVGAAGPIVAGSGTCDTTVTTLTAPVTLVCQRNGSSNGGGGVLICSVSNTNHFVGTPDAVLTSATVYQCVGSVIAGPGALGTCTPVNTPGVTSVTAAAVGQCNGSGNGGTSVGFTCSVDTASTVTSTLAVNLDQCNDAANGSGALVRGTTAVMNQVTAATPTPTPTASPTVTPTRIATAAATATPVVTAPSPDQPSGGFPTLANTGSGGVLTEPGSGSGAVLLLLAARGGLLIGAHRFLSPYSPIASGTGRTRARATSGIDDAARGAHPRCNRISLLGWCRDLLPRPGESCVRPPLPTEYPWDPRFAAAPLPPADEVPAA